MQESSQSSEYKFQRIGSISCNISSPSPSAKFVRIVEKIEFMRQSQAQSKQQIEDLFSALMQKAFRGELDKSIYV